MLQGLVNKLVFIKHFEYEKSYINVLSYCLLLFHIYSNLSTSLNMQNLCSFLLVVFFFFFYVTMEFSACHEGLYDVLSGKTISLTVCDPPPANYIYKK